jgi:hypothetical protein
MKPKFDEFVKSRNTHNFVIPVKTGIHNFKFQAVNGYDKSLFRIWHPSFPSLRFLGVGSCMVLMLRRGNPPEPYAFPRWSMGTRNTLLRPFAANSRF